MSIVKRAAVAGLTGVIGLGLGLTLGVVGANAATAHHNAEKSSSHSATQNAHQKGAHEKKSGVAGKQHSAQDKTELKAKPKAQQEKVAKTKEAQTNKSKSATTTPQPDTTDKAPAADK